MRAPAPAKAVARKLRGELSLPEKLIWVRVRRREPDRPTFRRQHPIEPYVLDFYCAEARLCIEIDGQGHGFGDRPARDERRDAFLRELGIDVVRIAASSVLKDPGAVALWMFALARERMVLLGRTPQ